MKEIIKCSDLVTYYYCAKLFSNINFLELDFLYRKVEGNLFSEQCSPKSLLSVPNHFFLLVKCQNYIPQTPSVQQCHSDYS